MKIRAGFVIHNPLTNSKTVVLKTEVETQGRGWLLEVECVPNNLPDIAEHLHTTWTETFEIISGEANYKIDGIQKTARTGDVFVVNPRQTIFILGQLEILRWFIGKVMFLHNLTQKLYRMC